MPRTNTEIDKDLEKTKGAVADADKSLAILETRVDALQRELDLREKHQRESLGRLEKSVGNLQSRLWQLFILILGSIITAAVALGKDSIVAWIKK